MSDSTISKVKGVIECIEHVVWIAVLLIVAKVLLGQCGIWRQICGALQMLLKVLRGVVT